MNQAYELLVIWDDGKKEIHVYPNERLAYQGLYNFKMAFGLQISWACVRKHREVFEL